MRCFPSLLAGLGLLAAALPAAAQTSVASQVRVDASFDPGSSVTLGAGVRGVVTAVGLQPDGKIFIAGSFDRYRGVIRNRVARLTSSGALDAGFDPGAGVGGGDITGLVTLPDGKILLSGSFTSYDGVPNKPALLRVRADGFLDQNFDAKIDVNSSINALVRQSDGKYLVLGVLASASYQYLNVALLRLNEDGSPDRTFRMQDQAAGISKFTLLNDGKILIVGSFTAVNGVPRSRIARLLDSGEIDPDFDPAEGPNADCSSVAVQSDGRIMIVGQFNAVDGVARRRVARLTAKGALDGSFNPGYGTDGPITTLVLQPDDKAIIGGGFLSVNSVSKGGIARLNLDGSFDPTFDLDKALGATTGGINDNIFGSTLRAFIYQADGKIFIGGDFETVNGATRKSLARLAVGVVLPPGIANDPRLINVSTRARVETGDNLMIGGFVVQNSTGGTSVTVDTPRRSILVRALGPSLAAAGLGDLLARPTLEIRDGAGGLVASNAGWQTDSNAAAIAASGLAPGNPNESCVLLSLYPGAYTALVRGAGANASGVAIVEAYDLDTRPETRVANLSTRAKIGGGDGVLIGGFAVRGGGKRLLVRAMGPTLAPYGVNGAIADPVLRVFDAAGNLVAENDNWQDRPEKEAIRATGRQPYDPREAAILFNDLPIGNYTAVVSGAGGSTGVGLVEIYEVP